MPARTHPSDLGLVPVIQVHMFDGGAKHVHKGTRHCVHLKLQYLRTFVYPYQSCRSTSDDATEKSWCYVL